MTERKNGTDPSVPGNTIADGTSPRDGVSRVLVTGATGFLGRAVVEAFELARWQVFGTGFSRATAHNPRVVKLDLLDSAAVETLIKSTKPDFIVHCAAERSPDAVAANPDQARALNVNASASLASVARLCSIPILYISTEYVFPGTPGEAPYAESAIPRPTNLYGQLKLEGEQEVLREGGDLGAIFRVPVLYGRVDPSIGNKESAVNVLLDAVRKATTERVVMDDWAQRYPTNVSDIGKCIVEVARKWLLTIQEQTAGGFPSRLQFCAEECFTKYEMCQVFADILGVDISKMDRNKVGNDSGSVQRPYDTHMSTKALEAVIGGKLQTVKFRDWWTRELCT